MAFVDPLTGRQLGSFQIERLLGRGGMAKVYYGLDVHLQRPVAIKVIDERYRGSDAYAHRFVREARAMAAWRHPNIPQIYQAGQEDGIYYYAMEFIHGLDLARLLELYARRGELPPVDAVLRVGHAVAAALDYAHGKGAIHRDVKPSNVLVAQDGRILLTDFGLVMQIARGTMGEVFGSPHYIAPEQARSSAQAVPQSDLYALGVILYEMLAGELPFDDPSPAALALKHVSQAPPSPRQFNPELSPAVESVLLKALHKSPEERYRSGQELMSALEEALAESPALAVEGPPPETIPILVTGTGLPATEPPAAATVAASSRRTVSRLQLDELVAGQLETRPPQTQAFAGPQSQAQPRRQAAAAPARQRLPLWGGIGCAVLLALAALSLVIAAVWAVNRPDRTGSPLAGISSPSPEPAGRTPTQAATPFAYMDATFTAVAQAAGPVATPTPTDAPPTRAPTATPEPTATGAPEPTATEISFIELEFAMYKDDSLFVINQSPVAIPLAFLQLGRGDGHVSGEEWDLDLLDSGQCVSVWKKEGNPRAPEGLDCEPVGERVEREGGEKFWTSEFEVYYQGARIDTCNGRRGSCTVQIPLDILLRQPRNGGDDD